MTTILHISDMHDYDGNTLKCLGRLAQSRSDVDVVAVTGDCFRWSNEDRLPKSWNEWHQRLKLSVPGDHDGEKTFELLNKWPHTTPYVRLLRWDEEKAETDVVRPKCDRIESYVSNPNDITFIGLDTSKDFRTGKPPKVSNASEDYDACSDFNTDIGYRNVKKQIDEAGKLDRSLIETGSALVILSHRWPQLANKETKVWDIMLRLCGERRPLLILCGHEHHHKCRSQRWSKSIIQGMKCYRSQVHSNKYEYNLITWDGECFKRGEKSRKGSQ